MKIDWKLLEENRIKDKTRFYLIISGDKDFTQSSFVPVVVNEQVSLMEAQDVVARLTDGMLKSRVENKFEIIVNCGDNQGADLMANIYANSRQYECKTFKADWDNYGNKAGYLRNQSLFTHVGLHEHKGGVIFWDGEDSYTRNLIFLGWEYGVPLRVFNYKLKRWLKKDEIEEVQDQERRVQARYGRV